MGTSVIGPGFLTQTATFTQTLMAGFGFVILLSILSDIGAQLNIWCIITVFGQRVQDIGNQVFPGAGYFLALLTVMGGLAFNIGNVGGAGLGLNLRIGDSDCLGHARDSVSGRFGCGVSGRAVGQSQPRVHPVPICGGQLRPDDFRHRDLGVVDYLGYRCGLYFRILYFRFQLAPERHKKWIIIGFIAVSAPVLATIGRPAQVPVFVGTLNGLILPVSLGLILLAAYKTKIVGDYKHLLWMTPAGVLVVIAMAVLSAQTLIKYRQPDGLILPSRR
uniref:Uncharacterized protein n=1 Tax=Neisseria leonii TaxID=2995413 RepID=A0A9X4IBA6_9NEIS|nr:hypothetical protein [Neisseria sp. 51.81]MDD9328194.1 hypothetical protein [Neisseria sp. 51.81]